MPGARRRVMEAAAWSLLAAAAGLGAGLAVLVLALAALLECANSRVPIQAAAGAPFEAQYSYAYRQRIPSLSRNCR